MSKFKDFVVLVGGMYLGSALVFKQMSPNMVNLVFFLTTEFGYK